MSDTAANSRPSKKQRELLTFIEGFITAHGYGPSYREIMRALDYKSVSTVAVHVDNLIKKGHLIKRDKSARSLELRAGGAKTHDPAGQTAKPVTHAQEKWLIDQIAAHFMVAEKQATSLEQCDHLFVLIGALHILGFPEAARAYQGRLQTLKQQLGGS